MIQPPYAGVFENRHDDLATDYSTAFANKEAGRVGLARRQFERLRRIYVLSLAEEVEVKRQEAVCCRKLGMKRRTHQLFGEACEGAKNVHPDLVLLVLLDWSAARLDQGEAQEVVSDFAPRFEQFTGERHLHAQLQGYFGRALIRTNTGKQQEKGFDLMVGAIARLENNRKFKALCLDFEAQMLELLVWPRPNGTLERKKHFRRVYKEARQVSLIRAAEVYLRYKSGARWLPLAATLNGFVCRLNG